MVRIYNFASWTTERQRRQVIGGFEPRGTDTDSLIANVSKDSIEYYQPDGIADLLTVGFANMQQQNNAEAKILLTAVWVAHQEGWIFLEAV